MCWIYSRKDLCYQSHDILHVTWSHDMLYTLSHMTCYILRVTWHVVYHRSHDMLYIAGHMTFYILRVKWHVVYYRSHDKGVGDDVTNVIVKPFVQTKDTFTLAKPATRTQPTWTDLLLSCDASTNTQVWSRAISFAIADQLILPSKLHF